MLFCDKFWTKSRSCQIKILRADSLLIKSFIKKCISVNFFGFDPALAHLGVQS